ncbi:MAG: Na+/H+ antiporter subunit E [Pseudomonadota bacterium]
MNVFSNNVILAVVWTGLMGELSLFNLFSGFLIGFAALWIMQPLTGRSPYFFRVFAWARLIVMFLYELLISSLAVAWDVLTPRHRARPAIIEMPLDVTSDAGILLVTNLITLTPGTLSLDVSDDRKTLRIHAMFGDNPDALLHELKSGMEKWVLDAVESG